MSWEPYKKNIVGTRVEGDPGQPETNWWNHLLLIRRWTKLAVFRVKPQVAGTGFRIGFKNFAGKAYLLDEVLNTVTFAVRLGREACTFFALDLEGIETPITLELTTRLY